METPKVVVFDLGKVLLDFDYGIAARRIAARTSLTPDQVRQSLDHSPLMARYETGQLTTPGYFDEVQRTIGFSGTLEEFGEYFADIFTPMQGTIALQQRLRQDGIRTWLFSNTSELVVSFIRRRYPFFTGFDGYVLSYEEGSLKPQPRIYEAVERGTRLSGVDIAYLDDRPENVAAGAARGWRTVVHESAEKTAETFKSWGLL